MIRNLISVIFTFFKFCLLKIVYFNKFKFKVIERFSPNTQIKIRKNSRIELKSKVRAHSRCKLVAVENGNIEIGKNVAFNDGCGIYSMKHIIIGEGTMFGPNVLVYDHDHDYRSKNGISDGKFKIGEVKIGKNVWIGANTIILRDTSIGDNCVIAAGSVIKGEFPDNSLIIQKRKTESFQIKTINKNGE